MTRPTWKYTNPAELPTNGIYTEKELDEIRERIMFSVERPAVLNDLACEMRGHPLGNSEGSLSKLLNEDAVEKIIDSKWNMIWTRFLNFRSISAGFITFLIIIHFIKINVGIILQGYVNHSVYG